MTANIRRKLFTLGSPQLDSSFCAAKVLLAGMLALAARNCEQSKPAVATKELMSGVAGLYDFNLEISSVMSEGQRAACAVPATLSSQIAYELIMIGPCSLCEALADRCFRHCWPPPEPMTNKCPLF